MTYGGCTDTAIRCQSVVDAQSDAAVDGVADRLRARSSVDEQVGDPALGDPQAEPAAIFEPALVSDRRRYGAVTAGHGGGEAGMVREGLHESAIDVALDVVGEQMRPLSADLDEIGLVGAGGDRGVERIERDGLVRVTTDPLPQLPDLDGCGDLVTRRDSIDPAGPAVGSLVLATGLAIDCDRAEVGHVAAAIAHLLGRRQDGADIEERP